MRGNDVQAWCDFLESPPDELHAEMVRLYREACDTQSVLERFAMRFKDAPSTDLRVQHRILSHAMSAIVIEIGMQRRELWRARTP
jgi:hypothetical protein